MKITDKPLIDQLRQELEQHFNKELSPRMREAFCRFALENFVDFPAFEKACELVCANELTFGRFPTFPRFIDLYREWRAANSGPYAEHKALPPSPDKAGYSGPIWDLERLKAKVRISGHLMDAGLRADAVEEAVLKGIDLPAIGVAHHQPDEVEAGPRPERGLQGLRGLFGGAVSF